MRDYWDIDSILAENQAMPCTFDPKSSQELPLFLASALAQQDICTLSIPHPSIIEDLQSTSFIPLSGYFFSFYAQLMLIMDMGPLGKLVQTVFRDRLGAVGGDLTEAKLEACRCALEADIKDWERS